MLSSQFVKGNVPDESSIVGGHLETALQSNGNNFSTVLLLILSGFGFHKVILLSDLRGL